MFLESTKNHVFNMEMYKCCINSYSKKRKIYLIRYNCTQDDRSIVFVSLLPSVYMSVFAGAPSVNHIWILFREFVFKGHYGCHAMSRFTLSSALCSSLFILSFPFAPVFFHPLLSFLPHFWMNKLVSLMSNDTSRSQSQFPNNKMPPPSACLFQFSLHLAWC